jgi:prepilin signal peptidase PulO-like enzyme (type II secretory pathway)
MTLVAYVVPFSVLAAFRALQGGPLPRDLRHVAGVTIYALGVLGFALTFTTSPRTALGFAFLFVCAWTDVTARKVYLPVTIAAFFAALVQATVVGELAGALIASAVMAAVAFVPYIATRGRGFGLGDVLLAAVVGGAFGLQDGGLIFAFGFIVGAIIASILLASKVIARQDPLPMVTFVAAGSLVLVGVRAAGWNLV